MVCLLIDKRRKKDKQDYHDDTTSTIVNCSIVVGHTRSFGMVDGDDDDDQGNLIIMISYAVSRYTIEQHDHDLCMVTKKETPYVR